MANFFSETYFADKFICIRYTNNEKTVKQINKQLKSRFIQFHFILKNTIEFLFNDGNYKLEIINVKLFINWDITSQLIEGWSTPNLYGLLFVSGLITE